MLKSTTIAITKPQKENIDEVKNFLRENNGVNPSCSLALFEMYKVWKEKKGEKLNS